MSILNDRDNRAEEIMKGKFIRNRLEETAKDIDRLQRKAKANFKSDFWNNTTFAVSDGTLMHTHDKRQRYSDMKTRTNKDGSKHRKKSTRVHNSIIWGQYNYLTRELAYGYTEAAIQEIKKLED